MNIQELIKQTSIITAKETVKRLKKERKVKEQKYDSFTRTEALLRMYPLLPTNHEDKILIDKALKTIDKMDLKGIIKLYYFEGMTFEDISDKYNCKYQTISKNRNKLVRRLAKELFLEEVLKEIKEN